MTPPVEERDGTLERRCHVTLLFSDLCNYTALSEACDPEEIATLRRQVQQIARQVIGKHGGAINQFVGDGMLAVFGFPQPVEDGGRRAVEAALELHELTRGLTWESELPPDFRVQLHTGVHSGMVFFRQGDPLHGRYELTGDAVNTAARLCSSAGGDEVLVSESALLGLEPFFTVGAVEPLSLKGKQRPVPAYRVLGRSDVETRFQARSRRGLTPFVGRIRELGQLEDAVNRAASGRGVTLSLVGDAGMGKTRLLDELRRRLASAGLRVQRGSCESYGGVAPLRPFLQMARELFAESAPGPLTAVDVERSLTAIDESLSVHVRAFLHLLSLEPWPAAVSPDELQLAVIAAVTDLLLALGKHRPLLLIVDDWQWSDDASTQVLGRLSRAIHDRPITVVVGSRSIADDDPVLGQLPQIRLMPFSQEEALAAVQALATSTLPPAQAISLHQRSGGNPLYLEELCRSLSAGSEILDEVSAGAVPSTIHGLIHARIERLEPEQAELLRVASVIGNEFPLWLLSEVCASDPAPLLVAVAGSGLVDEAESAGVFRFKHGITREVVYESVRMRERRRLHGEVARALERRFEGVALAEQYEVLASHYAGSLEYRKAADFAELAGDKAAGSSALDRAHAQYAAAMAHLDQLSTTPEMRKRWLRVVAKWSGACVFRPDRSQLDVLARCAKYAEELEDYDALAHTEYWQGWIHYAIGEQPLAVEHSERALGMADRAQNQRLAAQLLSNIGQSHAAAGAYEQALSFLERGIELKRQHATQRGRRALPVGFVYALGCKALVHADRGDFQTAYAHLNEALEEVQGSGHAIEGSLLCQLGMTQIWQGRWQEALDTAARGRATGERVNGPYVRAICQTVGGYARWVLGRSDTGLDELSRSVQWLEQRDVRLYLSFGYCHLADALLQAGEVERAKNVAERALERAELSDPIGAAMARRTLARAEANEGRRDEALMHCERALVSAKERDSAREQALTWLCLGELELLWGARDDAKKKLENALATCQAMGMTWHGANASGLLAQASAI